METSVDEQDNAEDSQHLNVEEQEGDEMLEFDDESLGLMLKIREIVMHQLLMKRVHM